MRDGKTLCLKGGIYRGKFSSTLNGGGVVRSAPGEWAILDGNATTTLSGAMNSTQTTFAVADASAILSGSNVEVWIDNEIITVHAKNGNNITSSSRNAEGTVGGAASHGSGSTVKLIGGKQLEVAGGNTTYRDFEILNSNLERGLGAAVYEKFRGHGIFNLGNGNSFINLIVHDNVNGIFSGSASSNTLLYGCIFFNNGLAAAADYSGNSAGLNMYLENSSGYSRVYETFALNSFNGGGQYYGVTASYAGGDTQGSVFAGSGSPLGVAAPNLIFGPESVQSPTGVVSASHFVQPHTANTGNLTMGYGAGVTNATITNNFFVGSATSLEISAVSTAQVTGNKFYSSSSGSRNVLTRRGTFTWNNNTYYGTPAASEKFGNVTDGVSQTFATSQSRTGFDSSSTVSSGNLPDTVIVRPNTYESGRANIIVHAASSPSSINVDLSATGLSNGQAYTIKNAFNWNGQNVLSGTYNSASPIINVPLNSAVTSVAVPIGMSSAPSTMAPKFVLLVVKRT